MSSSNVTEPGSEGCPLMMDGVDVVSRKSGTRAPNTKEGAMVIRSSRRDTAATAQSSSHGSEYKTTALKCAAQSSAWCKHPISPHCVLCLLTILGVCTPVYVPQCTPVLTILGQPDLLCKPSRPSQMRAVNHKPHKWCLYCSKAGTVRA